jgi:hypothetical protein
MWASPAAKKKEDIRKKIRRHIDIHELAGPDELQVPDLDTPQPDEPGPELERVPFIPLPEPKPISIVWDTPPETAGQQGTSAVPGQRGAKSPRQTFLPAWAFTALIWSGGLALLSLVGWLVYNTAVSAARLREKEPRQQVAATPFTHDACLAMAKAFLAAKSPAGQSAFVRDPERVRPFMDAFAPKVGTGTVIDVRSYGFARADVATVFSFLVKFSDGGSRVVCVISTPDGPKVDWEAFARHGTATATDLKNGKAATAEVRVLATAGSYYNYRFLDDKLWRAVELANADWADSLTGYVRANSATANKLEKLMDDADGIPVPVLLRLSVDAESAPRGQCVIEELVVPHWVKP